MNQAAAGLALAQGHGQRREREVAIDIPTGRPADNPPGKQVENDREIQPAFLRPQKRDVSDPRLVGTKRGGVALQHIRRDGEAVLRVGGCAKTTTTARHQLVFAHQPGHPLAPRPIPGSFEVGMNAGTAVSSSAPVVNRGYPLGQIPVTTRMQRGGPSLAGVVATGRNGHDAAEDGDGEGHLLLGDEREPHALSLAKKVAALWGISRSMRRTFTSRRRCESSSFSAVVRAPGGPLPSSTSACRHQSYTRLFAGLKSFATCATLRPARTSATVSALNWHACACAGFASSFGPTRGHLSTPIFLSAGVHQIGSSPSRQSCAARMNTESVTGRSRQAGLARSS